MLRENESPDKAVQFSNLYARLLTQPVLSQKWAILYLLYQIADSDDADGAESESEALPLRQDPTAEENDKDTAAYRGSVEPPAFNEAFSSGGLSNLPTRETRSREMPPPIRPTERTSRSRAEREIKTAEGPLAETLENVTSVPTEAALLRDLPFTLQGLSSTHLPFLSASTLALPSNLPLPLISLLHTLAEPSLLYRSVSGFVQSRDEGVIGQSLRYAIGSELRSYLGLIATLEGEIRRAIASLQPKEPGDGVGKTGVTLKRCVVWTREATMGLRLMSLMAEKANSMTLLDVTIQVLTTSRQERRSTDHNDSRIFNISW